MSSVNDYMMEFARGMIGWEDGCDQERLRAIFTTYCAIPTKMDTEKLQKTE